MQSFSLKLSAAIIHLNKTHCGRHKSSEPVFSVVSGSSFVLHSIVLFMVSEHEGMLHNVYVLESV